MFDLLMELVLGKLRTKPDRPGHRRWKSKRKEGKKRAMADDISLITEIAEEEKDLSHPAIVKTEVNFANLPFFALSRQDAKKKIEVRYTAKIERDGKTLEVLWSVTPNVRYGYPGPFDRKVHKAIECIIGEQGIPIENPVPFSLYRIIQILGIKRSGRTVKEIRDALRRIVHTAIDSEGTFYSKSQRQYISDSFHLYDRVIFREQTLPNGEAAETNYLFLSGWYLDSINNLGLFKTYLGTGMN